jgi:hypothetical protein
MPTSADYLIIQYIRNPIRREARNVGLIVIFGDSCAAKFIGEIADTGEIDRRSTKWALHPTVYRKWIKYWREQLGKGTENLANRLKNTNGDNYDVIRGGCVTDFGNDSPETICDRLFPILVEPDETRPVAAVGDAGFMGIE